MNYVEKEKKNLYGKKKIFLFTDLVVRTLLWMEKRNEIEKWYKKGMEDWGDAARSFLKLYWFIPFLFPNHFNDLSHLQVILV